MNFSRRKFFVRSAADAVAKMMADEFDAVWVPFQKVFDKAVNYAPPPIGRVTDFILRWLVHSSWLKPGYGQVNKKKRFHHFEKIESFFGLKIELVAN